MKIIQATKEEVKEILNECLTSKIEDLKAQSQPKELQKYLTRKNVLEMLSISDTTLYNWTNKGILKAYGIGGRTLYRLDEIQNAIIELKK